MNTETKDIKDNKNPRFEETKKAVMDSLQESDNKTQHFSKGKFHRKGYRKDWLSIRLSLQINLMVWELIPFNDHSIMTSRQAFVLRWLCFTLIGKKPEVVAVWEIVNN